ncbi:hypothetical protein BDV95DRAFT_501674 [Massariosphaeria phaeospora]|uniref:NTF2 and RRM domain-containing protein n=1 Tax=Massariosphaeria phaeospora TaxID=100035 RepID=A0A7C8M5D0_9PLEO|nr:hypothetical protein BDV95DRAFT_501674 [Massariosphaeria phaeospora]
MATTESAAPINGNYAPGYDASANNYAATNSNSTPGYVTSQNAPTPANNASTSEIPKDEVGWYFVEQYYTTLSKSPDRLYLFYNKRSQYVYGTEEDKVNVSLGQKAINDRIKAFDFHDTKVRVTNVDSQGSDANIVIQVIGEISNKGQPHKRFVQTFVLAEQTNGYFVLNDIFRYLAEDLEEDEDVQQDSTPPTTGAQESAPDTAAAEVEDINHSPDAAASEEDLTKVDQKLEEVPDDEPAEEDVAPPAAVNGTPVPEPAEKVEEETSTSAVATSAESSSQEPEETVAKETLEPEKPKDPAPTPAPTAPKAAPAATPSAPPKPTAPRTWASLAASAHKVATPAVPSPAASQAPSQTKSITPAATSTLNQPLAVPSHQTSGPAREPSPANSQSEASGWQPVTGNKKEQTRVQNQPPAVDSDSKRAYIKNVYSQVEEVSLRGALSKFGEIEYLDISRPKNCAFVDFKTPAGFQAAVTNNPHNVNGLEIKVEERRTRTQPFVPYPRGGAPRGRGGMNQAPRGGFQPRGGRGGSISRGGRGAPQEA